MQGFIEEHCAIEHEGATFEAGGAWLAKRVDTGKYEGILYMLDNGSSIGTWHGDKKVRCSFGESWISNFGDERMTVWFHWDVDGVQKAFMGTWYKSAGDYVRCKEVKDWKK